MQKFKKQTFQKGIVGGKVKDVITYTYNRIKDLIYRDYFHKDFDRCVHKITAFAKFAYKFNWIYSDDQIEHLMQSISINILPLYTDENRDRNKWVFYDSFFRDNSVLTEQYIKAFISYGIDLLIISENNDRESSKRILSHVLSYSKVKVIYVDDSQPLSKRLNQLYNYIADFRPDKIFMQLAPWSASAVILFNAFHSIPRYYISINDHTFCLGKLCTDFSIEFRNRGRIVSLEKRGLKPNQILVAPYYPIIDNKKSLQGFPITQNMDRVIIFTGGSAYKIYDRDNIFFKILSGILSQNKNTIVLFASYGYLKPVINFINEHNYQNQFFLIGKRQDISQLVEISDIYLNTYPMNGGLMCQLAASLGKPIVSYNIESRKSEFAEQFVCHNSKLEITRTGIDQLLNEVHKLCVDKNYRRSVGDALRQSMITETQFNERLYKLVTENKDDKIYEKCEIDFDYIFDRDLYIESVTHVAAKQLLRAFGVKSFFLFPGFIIPFLPHFGKFLTMHISNKLQKRII